MGIALEFKENIQLVALDGKITKAEESALRLKLDQKFSQGRILYIFKVDRYEFQDPDSLSSLQGLIAYLVKLGAFVGVCGGGELQHRTLNSIFSTQCKGFDTELEAIKWVLEESQKPKDGKPKPRDENEEKRKEIEQLISSYAIHFYEHDPDPYRITKLAQEYLSHPTADFMQSVRSLVAEVGKIQGEVQKKDEELTQLEQLLLEYMNVRKLPATDMEIQSHTKLSEAKASEIKQALTELTNDISKKGDLISNYKKQGEEHHSSWAKKVSLLERELDELKKKHEKMTQEMQKKEKEETETLQKLRPGAS